MARFDAENLSSSIYFRQNTPVEAACSEYFQREILVCRGVGRRCG
jgi:hypothetical protein